MLRPRQEGIRLPGSHQHGDSEVDTRVSLVLVPTKGSQLEITSEQFLRILRMQDAIILQLTTPAYIHLSESLYLRHLGEIDTEHRGRV